MSAWRDLRHAMRGLGKNPGFTVVTVLTLALGVGVSTAIFSIVNAVLLRPLPFNQPERLVRIWEEFSSEPLKKFPSSEVEFDYFRKENQVFAEVAEYSFVRLNLTGSAQPEVLQAAAVSPSLFRLLGVQPALGRPFLPEEDQPGKQNVILVSDATWHNRFGSDPHLLGRTLVLNDEPSTVVGIMPPGFRFPSRPDPEGNVEIWVPEVIDRANPATVPWGRRGRRLFVIARRKPGVAIEQAQSGMDSVGSQFHELYLDSFPADATWGIKVVPMQESEVQEIRPALLVLAQAGGLVLLITCANVSNLLLIHLQKRKKEHAIRTAIGASHFQIVRRFVVDGLLFAVLGGALGILFSAWGVRSLVTLAPPGIPRIDEARIDLRVLGFALAISLLAGVLTVLIPVFRSPRLNSFEDLKEAANRTTGKPHGYRFRNVLVVAEIALALVVLVGAGLLIKDFRHLQEIDPGFQVKSLLTTRISLPGTKYKEAPQISGFYHQLLERVQALPGVQAAGIVSQLPLSGTNSSHGILFEGGPMDPKKAYEVDFRFA
ncbi:MAG TPA: ABC transporter permease, partial [Thermoanaerobaculia bacterium]|nr:ABC transporter permease [Thermoanaerobaculia bacterium]